jgi:glycosyltransferase involved in cell wall biosynthesis
MNTYLSLIIPFYNEADNLKKGNLQAVYDYLKSRNFEWEMILVNDGSSDNSLQLVKDFAKSRSGIKIIDNPHQGKAATVAAGVFAGRGEYVLFSDTDQSTPISELDKFIPYFKSGFQVVIGSRTGRKGAPFYRQILARGMVIFRFIILRLPFKDTQCGFKAFQKTAAVKIFSIMQTAHPPKSIHGPSTNPGFDVEFLYLARKLGLKIAEVPVLWTHQKSNRVSFIKDSINGLKELLLIRWRSVTKAYKI